MLNATARAALLIVLPFLFSGCRRLTPPSDRAGGRVKDVSYRKVTHGQTLVLGPTHEISLPDIRKSTPLIDGILNDSCWRKSARAKDFALRRGDVEKVAKSLNPNAKPADYASVLGLTFNEEGECLASEQTEARLCHGTNAIYLAFDCKDSHLVAKTNRMDGPVLEDDCVELVINTQRNVFHIAANPRGVLYTSRVATSSDKPTGPHRWHPSITARTGKHRDTWQCEMAIPFRSLEIKSPSEGSFLGLNIGRRNRPPVKHERYEMEEISTWSPAGFSLLEPRSEGIMFFRQGPDAMIAYLDPGQPGFGYNRAVVGLRNRRSVDSKIMVRLVTFGPDGAIIESTSEDIALPPKETKMVTLTYKVPTGLKTCFLDAALFTGKPNALIGHQELELKLPPQLAILQLDKALYPKGTPVAWGKLDLGLGELRIQRYSVDLRLSGAGKQISSDKIRALQSPLLDFSLGISDLAPGRYTLTAEVREGGEIRGKTERSFAIQ